MRLYFKINLLTKGMPKTEWHIKGCENIYHEISMIELSVYQHEYHNRILKHKWDLKHSLTLLSISVMNFCENS